MTPEEVAEEEHKHLILTWQELHSRSKRLPLPVRETEGTGNQHQNWAAPMIKVCQTGMGKKKNGEKCLCEITVNNCRLLHLMLV